MKKLESNTSFMFQDYYPQNQQSYNINNEFLISRNQSNNLPLNEEDFKHILNKNQSVRLSK